MKTAISIFNYSVTNTNDSVDLHIDGYIVDADTKDWMDKYYGNDTSESYKSIRQKVDKAISEGCKTLNCHINSGGGLVTEAMAIHDYFVDLQSKGVTVNTHGRGLIASAATYILMAGNSSMSENSWFMIHNVSGFAYGDVNECENQVATLRKFNDTVTKFYCKTTGLSETVIGNMMNKETWLTGVEAKEKGFVNKCTEKESFTNAIDPSKWMFNNMEVLKSYNSFTQQNTLNMDIKKIAQDIKDAVLNALKPNTNVSTEITEAISNALGTAIENGLKPVADELQTTVTNAVTEATKGLPEMVANAIKELKLATSDDIANAVKPVNDELESVKKDFENRIKPAGPGNNEIIPGKKDATNHEGVTW